MNVWSSFRLLSMLGFLLPMVASPCVADLYLEKAALCKKYGEPEKNTFSAVPGCWDEGVAFLKDDLLIHVYLNNGKACSVVYGHTKKGQPISQTEILLLLNQNAEGRTWQPQSIADYGLINYTRSDGKAFASYDGNDARPCLNIMTKELWEAMRMIKNKATSEKGMTAPAKTPPARK